MAVSYIYRAPSSGTHNGEQTSTKTGNADLSAADWTAAADSADSQTFLCPRAFVPKVDGTLAVRGIDDTADTLVNVIAGLVYPIAIKQITRSTSSAALQIANAVALLY